MTDTAPALFDRLADRCDQVVPFFAGFAGQLLDVLAPDPGTRLLDIGSGRGGGRAPRVRRHRGRRRAAHGVAARRGPPGDRRAADGRPPARPARRLVRRGRGGFVIHLAAEPPRVLAGLRRILRPGGGVALTVPGPCEDHGRWDAWNALAAQFASRAAGRLPRRDYGVGPHLRAAGFERVRTVSLEVHLPVASPQACWDFHMSHGFAALVEALAPADAAEFRGRALAELARMHESGGIVLDRGAVAYLATSPGAPGPGRDGDGCATDQEPAGRP